jgi:hypothetical protein
VSIAEILKEENWKSLHPATKIVVKALQHIRSKVKDIAEVRAYFEDDELIVTTYKSEFRVTTQLIEFKRRSAKTLRVQRARVKLSREIINAIKNEIITILEYDYEPNYSHIVELLEKHLRKEETAE